MSEKPRTTAVDKGPRLWGLMAEFEDVTTLLSACERVRDAGFKHWDAYAPFPVHGLNDAMGIRQTRLPLLVLGAGVTGGGSALLLQWWMNAHDYPLIVSGKPFLGLPANIPIMFELTVLFSALTAFIGMLAMNDLPKWHHPVFSVKRFSRVTSDRFYITIESRDGKFDLERTADFLSSIGGAAIERVED